MHRRPRPFGRCLASRRRCPRPPHVAVASKFWVNAPEAVGPTTIAWTRCAPAVVPMTQRLPVRPSALVTPVSGIASPPPRIGVKTTLMPSTGRDFESVTRTLMESGSGVATTAVWPLPPTRAMAEGKPSLGRVTLSLLLHEAAATRRERGQARVRNRRGKSRHSETRDQDRGRPIGHRACPNRGRYGTAKVLYPQALAKRLGGAADAVIAAPRHPLWSAEALGY